MHSPTRSRRRDRLVPFRSPSFVLRALIVGVLLVFLALLLHGTATSASTGRRGFQGATITLSVPLISGSYRTCLQDYPHFNFIGFDGPCTVQHVIQPDYSGLPSATPTGVVIRWDGSGTQVSLEFYSLPGSVPWASPLPNATLFQTAANSSIGNAPISLATFATLKSGNLGLMVANPGGASNMDTQGWRLEATYAVADVPPTPTPPPSTTTISLPLISGSYRTCLQDYIHANFVGYNGPCTIQQVIQPNYSGLPAATPVDVVIRWDGAGTKVPLEFYKLTAPVPWGSPLFGGTLFEIIYNTDGSMHITPSLFATMKSSNLGIKVDTPWTWSAMDTQAWRLEVTYIASDVPPTPTPPPSTTTISVPLVSGTYRTCLQDYPNANFVGYSGPCAFQQVIQPDYSGLPSDTPVDVILRWDGSGSQVPLEFYRLTGSVPWGSPLPGGTLFKIIYSTVAVAHIDVSTFAALKSGNLGIMVNTPGAATSMDYQAWRLEVVYPSVPTSTPTPTNTSTPSETPTHTPTFTPTYTPTPALDQLTALAPAQVWVGLKNSDDVGTHFDLLAEVYVNGNLVSSGQLNGVHGGSSGFNNARLNTIPFNAFSPVSVPAGSMISFKLSVRNACSGPSHNSGTARLWFNDSAANSQFGATIASTNNTYFLGDGFNLLTAVGPGPKKTIDVAAGARCSPFKPFGTWNRTTQGAAPTFQPPG